MAPSRLQIAVLLLPFVAGTSGCGAGPQSGTPAADRSGRLAGEQQDMGPPVQTLPERHSPAVTLTTRELNGELPPFEPLPPVRTEVSLPEGTAIADTTVWQPDLPPLPDIAIAADKTDAGLPVFHLTDASDQPSRPVTTADIEPLPEVRAKSVPVLSAEWVAADGSRRDVVPADVRDSELPLSGEPAAEDEPKFLPGDPVNRLRTQLRSPDPPDRAVAAFLLGQSGPEASAAASELRQRLLYDADRIVRAQAALALLRIDPDDDRPVHVLLQLLNSSEESARWNAAAALGEAGPLLVRHPAVLDRLISALDDASPRVRVMAALTLGAFGPDAEPAVPDLRGLEKDEDPKLRLAARAALECITLKPAPDGAGHLPIGLPFPAEDEVRDP